jgi:hypothetical protein
MDWVYVIQNKNSSQTLAIMIKKTSETHKMLEIALLPVQPLGFEVDFYFNSLNAKLNPICYLLALLAYHFFHVSRVRVKSLTLRLLMSIYGAPILDVFISHTTTHHSR